MITNRDIEIAFVRAQNRINEELQKAQTEFMLDDMEMIADTLLPILRGKKQKPQPTDNPLMNEEI